MATEILKSFGLLQSELEQAKSSLKGVDENIKRLIGRDPSEIPTRLQQTNNKRDEKRLIKRKNHENEEPSGFPAPKRRNNSGVSVFKRLSDRIEEPETELVHKQIISKVIVTPKEVPSRQEALAAQSKDERSKERNRRMFGALLGTLQKFQQEEAKQKQKESKRAQLEKKIEEHENKEKQEIRKERQELFLNRRKKQAEIKMIELKMVRMREYASWEERQKPRGHFILTKAKPQIHYLPRRVNEATKALLDASKTDVDNLIEKRRDEVSTELKYIEERMKRNFETKANDDEDKKMDESNPEEENRMEEELAIETDAKDESIVKSVDNKEDIVDEEILKKETTSPSTNEACEMDFNADV